jgi:hypothetical protein
MRFTTECLQFLHPGKGGKINRRTGVANKNSQGGIICDVAWNTFNLNIWGSGGIRNRCTGEAKKNSQGGYYGTPLILISGK